MPITADNINEEIDKLKAQMDAPPVDVKQLAKGLMAAIVESLGPGVGKAMLFHGMDFYSFVVESNLRAYTEKTAALRLPQREVLERGNVAARDAHRLLLGLSFDLKMLFEPSAYAYVVEIYSVPEVDSEDKPELMEKIYIQAPLRVLDVNSYPPVSWSFREDYPLIKEK